MLLDAADFSIYAVFDQKVLMLADWVSVNASRLGLSELSASRKCILCKLVFVLRCRKRAINIEQVVGLRAWLCKHQM